MPFNLYGLKIDSTVSDELSGNTFILMFTTTIDQIFGSAYSVDGKKPGEESYAYNTGFATSAYPAVAPGGSPCTAWAGGDIASTNWISTTCYDWLATPDGGEGGMVPEPATLALFGVGLGLLATRVRRMQRR